MNKGHKNLCSPTHVMFLMVSKGFSLLFFPPDSYLSFIKFDLVGVSIIINFHALLIGWQNCFILHSGVKTVFWNEPDRLTTSSVVKLWCPPSPSHAERECVCLFQGRECRYFPATQQETHHHSLWKTYALFLQESAKITSSQRFDRSHMTKVQWRLKFREKGHVWFSRGFNEIPLGQQIWFW